MFLEQWRALSGRIRGVVDAGQLHARFLAIKSNDSYGRARQLRLQLIDTLRALESFRDTFGDSLPSSAVAAINGCVRKDIDISVGKLLCGDPNDTQETRQEQVWAALVMLAAFETEMTFILSDTQAVVRARSERAFSHLQRLIVVDPTTRKRWKDSLRSGEVACEGLGAVHLLWHGIWAFKVGGAGERTDLVLQQPNDELLDPQRYADGLVLTEWKIASSDAEGQKQFVAARTQAQRYAQGVLAGSELTAFRFLVVVSPQHITLPADFRDGATVYRHINIAADPKTPSQHRTPSKQSRRS